MSFRSGRVASLSAAALLVMLAGCSDDDGASEGMPEQRLEHRLEALDGVADAVVTTEEFDAESFHTVAEVQMQSDASEGEVAEAIDRVAAGSTDFDDATHDYNGLIRLADDDGDAVVETGADTGAGGDAGAEDLARWMTGAAEAAPDARIVVTGDSLEVTVAESTPEAIGSMAEQLADSDSVTGAKIVVRSAETGADDRREGGLALGARADLFDASLVRTWTRLHDRLARVASDFPPLEVSLSRDDAGDTFYVHLDVPGLKSPMPDLAHHRDRLWPIVRLLLLEALERPTAELFVEASSVDLTSTQPFVDFRTDGSTHPTDGDPDWQRLVVREAARIRGD